MDSLEDRLKYKPLKKRMCQHYQFNNTDDNFIKICKNLKCLGKDGEKTNHCICKKFIHEHFYFKPKDNSILQNQDIITIGNECINTIIHCQLLDSTDIEEFLKALYKKCFICKKYNIQNKNYAKWKNIVCNDCKNKNNKYKYANCNHDIDYYNPDKCLICERERIRKEEYEKYLLIKKQEKAENTKIWFGKNKGKTIKELKESNIGYLKWILDKTDFFNDKENFDNSHIRNYILC